MPPWTRDTQVPTARNGPPQEARPRSASVLEANPEPGQFRTLKEHRLRGRGITLRPASVSSVVDAPYRSIRG